MKISVIGCGYLGAVHAAAMAELGHEVVGVDVDESKVALLSEGVPPFVEYGFGELLSRNVSAGRLTFTSDIAAIKGARVHFIGVGTPQRLDGPGCDLSFVYAALEAMRPYLGFSNEKPELVVGKSTVPVGTAASLANLLEDKDVTLVWNPEFLREGFAVNDTLQPDRMVYGLPDDQEVAAAATKVLDRVYASIIESRTPRLLVDYATAELVKVAANSFLATKISFINAVARVCDETGANISALAEAIGLDDRIGRKFLRAGIGFGGGCLPKDIRAFRARASELGVGEVLDLLDEVDEINQMSRRRIVELARELLGELDGKKVAMLGATFKPDSDDLRDSSSLAVAALLADAGATVVITDPAAVKKLRTLTGTKFSVVQNTEDAVQGAHLIVLATEWSQYTTLSPERIGLTVAAKNIIDGRNSMPVARWKDAGWNYRGIGRR